jgi:hypothetical protein
MLTPLIMGAIASHFKGQMPSAAGLGNFLAEQKSNIANALPSGLSLDNIPGLAGVGAAARQMAGTAAGAAGAAANGGSKLLVPLVILLLAALAVWYFFIRPKTEVPATHPAINAAPDVGNVSKSLTGIYSKLTETIGSIKDAASAEAALPQLKDVDSQLDGMKALWDKVPEAGKTSIKAVTTEHLNNLKDAIAKLLELPGVADKVKPIFDEIVTKLSAFGGA